MCKHMILTTNICSCQCFLIVYYLFLPLIKPGIDLSITQINQIIDYNCEVEVSILVSMKWVEPRLKYANGTFPSSQALGLEFSDWIWMPDIYIYNLKSVHVPKFVQPVGGKHTVIRHPLHA